MRRVLLALAVVMLIAGTAAAQLPQDVPPAEYSTYAPTPPYKPFLTFDGFVNGCAQGVNTCSPLASVLPGDVLYGHVRWEHNKVTASRTYKMEILKVAGGPPLYTTGGTTGTGGPGEYWMAYSIPTSSLPVGWYIMRMTVTITTPAGPTSKIVNAKFRVRS